jgi:hypothetical protein
MRFFDEYLEISFTSAIKLAVIVFEQDFSGLADELPAIFFAQFRAEFV